MLTISSAIRFYTQQYNMSRTLRLSLAYIICQAKSGMGKTAVFVLLLCISFLQMEKSTSCCAVPHRELAFQIQREYQRFAKYLRT